MIEVSTLSRNISLHPYHSSIKNPQQETLLNEA